MAGQGSVSHWLDLLQTGDAAAAQPLWERYFQRLVGLARRKLQGTARVAADEEDVALSAFNSFCRSARSGRFPQLGDRDDLWRLLVLLTARKASHLRRDQGRQKRGGGVLRRSGAKLPAGPHGAAAPPVADIAPLEEIVGREPSPQFAAEVADECRRLLTALGDPDLEAVAVWKMEGYENAEIAIKLGCAPRTIERRLQLIRKLWEKEILP
jgi:DNA-directed RNA polymerase specialized sigma24 family protein